MRGLLARDVIAMGKNRAFLLVALALCVFYTVSDMYVTGVLLMPMLLATVCGNMIRNDLSAPIRRMLFSMPFSREQYVAEKYLVSIVPSCLLAFVLQALSAVIHRQSVAQSAMVVACATLLTVLTVSIEIPVNIIFRDRAQIARVCILAIVFTLVVLAVSLDMGADGLLATIVSTPSWALYGIGAALGAAVLVVSAIVSRHALRSAQL
ncbi:ABC-2 family transporter protein [Bifidobacterium italicum]|uniref:ABC-2 family transporter protein n=1 Tax=Bifidobacterium italicum TaxID=1960968 RepID=A0A2A2EIE2_9BIFI|nr:ABC-2 transporter permease [Bifidobacterium italicum]PAU68668.1 ABC-2 family transporter protein [Bifidobacterium italicum]